MDTFEAVKNNVYAMLGDLAQDFNGHQMDLLFTKFEDAHSWSGPDASKVLDLVGKLAQADAKVLALSLASVCCCVADLCVQKPVGKI